MFLPDMVNKRFPMYHRLCHSIV